MHDEGIGAGQRQLFLIQPEEVEIFADAGDEIAGHTLHLKAQHHNDISVFQARLHVVVDLHAHLSNARGNERLRPNQAHLCAHRREQMNVGARHPRMRHIAANRHDQAGKLTLTAANGEGIEQGLRRVFMRAIARVDHRTVDLLGEQLDRPGVVMADDEGIEVHGIQRHRRIDQRFAFTDRGSRRLHVDHIGPQPLGGQFKARPRAGGGFKKQVHHRLTAQAIILAVGLAILLHIGFRKIENGADLMRIEPFDAEKMAVGVIQCVHAGDHAGSLAELQGGGKGMPCYRLGRT